VNGAWEKLGKFYFCWDRTGHRKIKSIRCIDPARHTASAIEGTPDGEWGEILWGPLIDATSTGPFENFLAWLTQRQPFQMVNVAASRIAGMDKSAKAATW
jgi:hypothetical protein